MAARMPRTRPGGAATSSPWRLPTSPRCTIACHGSRVPIWSVALHIGSQFRDLAPLEEAYYRIGRLVANLCARGHVVDRVDLGGGLGIPYHADGVVPTLDAYAAMVAGVTRGWNVELTFELGRVVAGSLAC
jgi:diaminopimelate decarboxylase